MKNKIYEVEITEEGTTFYRDIKNKKYHREDGPAVVCSNGYKYWYKQGQLHREDGPAVEYPDGRYTNQYFLDGVPLSKDWYEKLVKKSDLAIRRTTIFDSIRSVDRTDVTLYGDSIEITRGDEEIAIPNKIFDRIVDVYKNS